MMVIRKTLVVFLAVVLLSTGAILSQAQRQTYRGTFRSVRQIILRIENGIDLCRKSVEAQNQRRVNGANGTNIDSLERDLETAVGQLQVRFDRRKSTAADVQEVLDRATVIDRLMGRNIRSASVQRNWTNLRAHLTQLGNVFKVDLALN